MKGILVLLIVFGSLPFILRRAQVGVIVYIWLSVMSPHRLTYGFTSDFGFAAVVAAVTLASALFSKDLKAPPLNALTVLLVLFAAWTGVTTLFAFYPEDSLSLWITLLKTMVFAFLIPMLFHTKEDLRALLWIIVLCIAYFGTKGGVWIVLTGGGERVWGPPGSYIEDNNALAVAIIMVIPLMRCLQLTEPRKWVRLALLGMMLSCGVSVIGSYSRGALLAVSVMVAYLCWKSRRGWLLVVGAIVFIPLLLAFMPEKWTQRMETLQNYEQDTGSAGARLNSWRTMVNIANDRPLVGGGFNIAMPDVYQRYSPEPDRKVHTAHSIYFQALGEHGYVGLVLYLLIWWTTWRKASAIIRASTGRPDLQWAGDFASMLHVTLVGFAIGGAFLSLVNFDVPYYLAGLVVATLAVVQRQLGAPSARAAPAFGQPAATAAPGTRASTPG